MKTPQVRRRETVSASVPPEFTLDPSSSFGNCSSARRAA